MAGSKKLSKGNLKKIFIVMIALMLVGGLVLSATIGFIDYLIGRKNITSPGEDENISYLREKAHDLEESVIENPDLESKAELGLTYYEMAMYYYWDLDRENVLLYSEKGIDFLLDARIHWERVLELAEEDSPEAQAARYYLDAYEIGDISGEKGEDKP